VQAQSHTTSPQIHIPLKCGDPPKKEEKGVLDYEKNHETNRIGQAIKDPVFNLGRSTFKKKQAGVGNHTDLRSSTGVAASASFSRSCSWSYSCCATWRFCSDRRASSSFWARWPQRPPHENKSKRACVVAQELGIWLCLSSPGKADQPGPHTL